MQETAAEGLPEPPAEQPRDMFPNFRRWATWRPQIRRAGKDGGESRPGKRGEPRFSRTAALVIWAPSATLAAAIAATVAAASVTWVAHEAGSIGTGPDMMAVAIAGFLTSFMLSLLIFAASGPTVRSTYRQLWGGLRLIILLMGFAGLALAFKLTAQHILGLLGW